MATKSNSRDRYVGWFNSCKCWAAYWTPKVTPHYIPTRLSAQERVLAPTYYGLIGGGLGLQVLLSAALLVYYREELRLIYGGWVESAQEQQASENGNAGRGGEDQGHGEGDDAIELSANGAGPL